MSATQQDLMFAYSVAEREFRRFAEQKLLSQAELNTLLDHYQKRKQKLEQGDTSDLQNSFLSAAEPCPPEQAELERLGRVYEFLTRELRRHAFLGRISAQASEQLVQTMTGRARKITMQLYGKAAQADKSPTPSQPQRASLIERLLDPQSLQILMLCGGGLLVVGLVIWLWSIGVFENRLVVASCLGAANLALIAVGVSVTRFTQHFTAGRAVTLLGSLLLPLNLWFYDAQGLITLNEGGQLWIPALGCCVIYFGIMRLLKDPLFVYTLVGGVGMTGLLLLGDQRVARFWEIISPSALLVIIGIICIHMERFFLQEATTFRRDNFGLAFFRAGHVSLSVGLGILFAGRIAGWLYEPFLASRGWFEIPDVAINQQIQLLALMLTSAATYTYIYSQLIRRGNGRFLGSAVLTLLWSEVILIDLLNIVVTQQIIVAILAFTAAALNLTGWLGTRRPQGVALTLVQPGLQRAVLLVGAVLTTLTIGWQLVLLGRGFVMPVAAAFPLQMEWFTLLGGVASLSACGLGAAAARRMQSKTLGLHYIISATALAITSASCGLVMAGLSWLIVLPLLAAGLAVVAELCERKFAGQSNSQLQLICCFEVGGVILAGLGLLNGVGGLIGPDLAIDAAWMHSVLGFVLAGLFARIGIRSQRTVPALLAALAALVGIWQLLVGFNFVEYAAMLAGSLLGVAILAIGRITSSARAAAETKSQPGNRFLSGLESGGMVCLWLSGIAGLLLTGNRLLGGGAEWSLVGLMAGQLVAALVSSSLVGRAVERRSLQLLAGGHLVASFLVINSLSLLTFFERAELFSIVSGLILLLIGHFGWRRETDGNTSDAVSFQLVLGSLFVAAPLMFGLVDQRLFGDSTGWGWVMLHEIGTLLIGLSLLGAGTLCRIRSTTLTGATALLVYVGSLVFLIDVPDQLQTIAVYMMVGGGLFFGSAVLLSVYRDRLLAMPEKIRTGAGVFGVLKWR